MFKNFLLIGGALVTLAACSAEIKSDSVTPSNPEEKTSAGPYTVDFNNPSLTYQHSFNMPINQSEGKVDYYITTASASDVELVAASLKVTGCPASQVVHQMFWLPDSQKTDGFYVSIGKTFTTRAGVQGSFLHSIRGLTGCSTVELSTTLRQKPKPTLPPRTCKESRETTCKVEVYCLEDYPGKKYVEFEVWKESVGTTLRRYAFNEDGTRSLTNIDTVTGFTNGTKISYSGSGSLTSLSFDTSTGGTGIYSLKAAGQTFPTEVICQSYL